MNDPTAASTDPGAPEGDSHSGRERRVSVRYPRQLDLVWQVLGVTSGQPAGATLVDLSVTGLGIRSDQPYAVGSALTIRLRSSTMGWATHLVRIKNCREADPGQFLVGCVFVKPLSPAQLVDLLT